MRLGVVPWCSPLRGMTSMREPRGTIAWGLQNKADGGGREERPAGRRSGRER